MRAVAAVADDSFVRLLLFRSCVTSKRKKYCSKYLVSYLRIFIVISGNVLALIL